jgi:hypothetical protein
MQGRGSFSRARAGGLVVSEFLTLFFVILVILLAMVNIFTLNSGDESVPPYRSANAMYVHQALESTRLAVITYREQFGALPGDDIHPMVVHGVKVTGNQDGRIDSLSGESAKVFPDMADAHLIPEPVVRIRGIELELLWLRLLADGKLLKEDNYFRLKGLTRDEAVAYDRKFDDGDPRVGDVVFFGDGDAVTFYSRLALFD